ncbi:MAG: dihydrodipicolinate synthase family protein [Thermaerobacter sp.]|nr:dihydrodipicolinate synthase family protein [Thermaerobacter sp.]
MPFRILAPVITPRDDRGRLDLEGLQRNVERLAGTSLDGFLALGSSGEYIYLHEQERLAVVGAVIAASKGKPVLAQVGAETTEDAVHLAEKSMALGAAGLLAVTPHYYTPQLRGAALDAFYRAVGGAGPVHVYHIPGYTGAQLDVADILRLAAVRGVVGMKDSSGNLAMLVEVLAARPQDFAYYVGSGGALPAALAHGADGTIAALANLFPDAMRAAARALLAGEAQTASRLQAPLARLNALVTRRYGIPGLKYAAGRLGFAAGDPVPPLQPLPEEGRMEIDAAINEIGA